MLIADLTGKTCRVINIASVHGLVGSVHKAQPDGYSDSDRWRLDGPVMGYLLLY
jgi:hypothetical protein